MRIKFEGIEYEADVDEQKAYDTCIGFVLPDGRLFEAEWVETSPPQVARLLSVDRRIVVLRESDLRNRFAELYAGQRA